MLTLLPVTPILLFGSFLYRKDLMKKEAMIKLWEDTHGPSFVFFPDFNPLKKYYATEMGEEALLERFLIVTKRPFPRERGVAAKAWAQDQEALTQNSGARTLNLDTGVLSAENFILFTTKNYSHRVYVGEGFYADLNLFFEKGAWKTLPWSYPDYTHPEKCDWLHAMRKHLLSLR